MFATKNGLSHHFFQPTFNINDLYSIYDEIGYFIIINTGHKISLIPEEFSVSVVDLFNNFIAFVDKL